MAWIPFLIIVLLAVLNFWLTTTRLGRTAEDRQNQTGFEPARQEAEYELAKRSGVAARRSPATAADRRRRKEATQDESISPTKATSAIWALRHF